MTKEEAIAALEAIDRGDTELAHVDADNILLKFLYANGFTEVADAWETTEDGCGGFWYA